MSEPSPPSLQGYRGDIDGLRAMAVIGVCGFHAGLPMFPGGFAGVDVFFVISGFLMGSVIRSGLDRGDFTFAQFFERRIRRIFPALFAMLAVTSVIACFVLTPRMFDDFGATLVAVAFNVANMAFAQRTANYFDAPGEFNPLLHTWSLSVEEQFYILFPVAMAVAWRLGRRTAWAVLAMAALASFGLSIWGTGNAPTTTFYILPTRAWELLMGALITVGAGRAGGTGGRGPGPAGVRSAAGMMGLALVAGSLTGFDAEMAFPGAAALIPCLGAALIIASGGEPSSLATRLLGLPGLVFIGKISYSLYLWHWPLIVFFDRYHLAGPAGFPVRAAVLLLAVPVAYASWRWVEQPFRGAGARLQRRGVFACALGAIALTASAGLAIQASHGWPARFPRLQEVTMARQVADENGAPAWHSFAGNRCFVSSAEDWGADACYLTHPAGGQERALLWGDSFAGNYAYGFFAYPHPTLSVLQYTSPGCPPVLGFSAAARPKCAAVNAAVAGLIRAHGVKTVIMAANWISYVRRKKVAFADVGQTVRQLHALGVRVVLVGQSPEFAFPYPDEYRLAAPGTRRSGPDTSASNDSAPVDVKPGFNAALFAAAGADVAFDPMMGLCKEGDCTLYEDGLYLFADYGHTTQAGSVKLVQLLMNALQGQAR